MVHTILYFGHFDRNFHTLAPGTTTYRDRQGVEKPVEEASPKADGFRFRYMERRGKEFVAVGLDDLVLPVPVLLIPERHTNGKGFFSPPQFEDQAAMHLLMDMIVANPERRDVLGRKLLLAEYQRLGRSHEKAVQARVARATLGSSVMRVFAPDTRPDLIRAFERIPVRKGLRATTTDDAFRTWFEGHLDEVARVIEGRNKGNPRIQPGAKWGHSTKVLTIFLREMVAHTRLFGDHEVPRIERLLYVPLDSITMARLGALKMRLPFKRIREIDTKEKFYDVQAALGAAALEAGVPRVWFDDNWGDREG